MNLLTTRSKSLLCSILILAVMSSSLVFAQVRQHPSGEENQQAALVEKDILILNGFQYGLPVADILTKTIVDSLRATGIPVGNIFVEYLDLGRKDNEVHRSIMLKMLQEKSRSRSIDLIIANDNDAIKFLENEAKGLFPDVPLIISYDKDPAWYGPLIIVTASNDSKGTVQYAFDLFPKTQHIVVIMGKDDSKAPFLKSLIKELEGIDRQVTIERTDGLSYAEMLQYISTLPQDSIAFYGSYFEDINGDIYTPAAVASTVGQVANAPVFAFVDMHITQGLIGGSVVIMEELGLQVAQLVLGYFSGTLELSGKPSRVQADFYPLFDWRQVVRWKADPRILPKETIFLNYEPTLWESHREFVLIAISFIAILAFLTVLLLLANRSQKATLVKLVQSEMNLLKAYEETIEVWAFALDQKDEETEKHSRRVTELTVRIAKSMGVENDRLIHIRRGALLHDIGKISIPDSILLKPGKLTEEEWKIMRGHTVVACKMLSKIDYLHRAMEIPCSHHEKWDGSGYPDGLRGEEIPLSARIFAIVDVYDALTSDRPYRKAWSQEKTLEHISEGNGSHFDPKIVEVFFREIENLESEMVM